MASSKEFDDAYSGLNDEQKKAVDAIEGPVFVIAGPGTGKTQVLTLRIANILRLTDTAPESILALTFTDAAAREMRDRLRRIIGSRASQVRIHTFHGFAESIISRFPDHFPRIIGSVIASDAERAELLDVLLLNTTVKHLRPFGDPLYYHPAAARAISTMKRENVTPDALRVRITEAWQAFEAMEGKTHEKGKYAGQMKGDYIALQKKIEKTEDLLAVYFAYEAGLAKLGRYDYDDLILEVVHALETDGEFKLQVQESLLYVLADEHQDANRAQNALLELVSGFSDRPNLFIVGDEKQAIYRFQGADLDNVHYFRQKFDGTQVVALVENYRSTQTILDSALSLIAASADERLSRVPLIANATYAQKPLTLTVCSTFDEEMAQLAENIKAAIMPHNDATAATAPGEVAVLVRRNKDVGQVEAALLRAGVAVTASGQENALHNRFVEALLRLLRAAADPTDANTAGVLTMPGFALSIADVARITRSARANRQSVLSVLGSAEILSEAKVVSPEGAQALAGQLESLVRMASFERPVAVAEQALKISGLLPRVLAGKDRAESLAAIRGLLLALEDVSAREHGARLSRALELLALYEERGISLPGRGGEDPTKVKVMTVHKSKGREFAQVFLPLLTSSAWSTRARPEHFYLPDVLSGSAELEDERRLLYVAITRAKEHATLSYSQTGNDDRAHDPTELLEDIDPELVQAVQPTADSMAWLIVPAAERTATGPSEDDLATLKAAFFAQGISPTALNNYLECPWKYFYVNLLRIPEAENKFLLFGTSVHAALKRYADERAGGRDIGAEGMVSYFNTSLERQPLSESEIVELRAKGERALTSWWHERHSSWPELTRAEEAVEAELPLASGENLLIRGVLDRIDETLGGYTVVDYKTGKPKSRNELMGATKDSDGNYYRQLTFYKLLLARGEKPRTMQEGVIEFVEPDDKGRIRTEAFTITDQEVTELATLIARSAEEITTLSFWNDPCNEADCAWCALRFGVA